jgi:hypothetical protein
MTEVVDALKEVTELTANFKKQQEEMLAKFKPNFHALFKPFLEKNTNVEALVFEAYTPYFNDGDTCEYSFNELRIVLKGSAEDEGDYGYGISECELHYNSRMTPADKSEYTKLFTELAPISKAFHSIPDDIMEGIVGDHVRVKITATDVETEDYEHD